MNKVLLYKDKQWYIPSHKQLSQQQLQKWLRYKEGYILSVMVEIHRQFCEKAEEARLIPTADTEENFLEDVTPETCSEAQIRL